MVVSPDRVSSLWTISTLHISLETFDDLEKEVFDSTRVTNNLISYRHDYGWFILVPSEIVLKHFFGEDSFPRDLLAILKIAAENKIAWVSLDCDAELEEGLPTRG
jgi:hypothetical protein